MIKVSLVGKFGVLLFGLLDYCFIYVIFKLNSKRFLFKIIWIRNFKYFNDKDFKIDIE